MPVVLGLMVGFVAVAGICLQMARIRASERWLDVVDCLHKGAIFVNAGLVPGGPPPTSFQPVLHSPFFFSEAETRGGNFFRAWRRFQVGTLVVRQDRSYFGSSMEARMSGGDSRRVAVVRAILAAVDVEVVVEP